MSDNIDYDYSGLSEDQLRGTLAGLQILKTRIDRAIGAAKTEYLRTHDATMDAEKALFDGLEAATLTVTRDSAGKWTVKDPEAYAAWLAEHLPEHNGVPTTMPVVMPTPAVSTHQTLERIVALNEGTIPDGVAWANGRAGGVTITLGKDVKDHAFDAKPLAMVARRLIAGVGE